MRMKKLYLLNPLDNAHAEHTNRVGGKHYS